MLVLQALAASAGEPRLIVGIDEAFPPYEFVDRRGEPAGFDVDLFAAAAEAAGLPYEFRAGPWHEILRQLEAGEIDVAAGVVRTEPRDARLDFSAPTVLVHHVVFVPAESAAQRLEDVAGSVVAVENGGVWEELIRERGYAVDVVVAASPAEVLRRVVRGEADAAILLQDQGHYLIRELGLRGLRSVGPPRETMEFRFAVPEGRQDLLRRLNDGLVAVHASGRYDEIHDRWLGVLQERPVWEEPLVRALLAAGGALLVIALASLAWSHTLQRRVDERSRALLAAQAEKGALQAQLLQSQKMEALGTLAGGVAHDFNNVLTVILGALEVGIRAAGDHEKMRKHIESGRTAARAAADLVRQLALFSRRQETSPQRLSWNALVSEHREMLQRLLGSTLRLETDLDPDLADVRVDPAQATQVLLNLVVNARDATKGRGHLRIATRNEARGSARLVRLTVSDDGCGMDRETRERIFEPFFTTKGEEGSGLGLATVYGIVERHGGTIDVESEPGRGASFHVDLPAIGT